MKKLFKRINQFSKHPLTKKNPSGALLRYVKFHLQHLIAPKPRVYPFVGDTRFIAERGMAGIVGNIYTGLYEFEEMAFLLHYLQPEDVFLDIGANVGVFSLLASGVCHANSFAVEPVPTTYEQLIQNIHLNALESKVKCLQMGLSDKSGTLEFSLDKGTMNRVVNNAQNSVNVPVQTIDTLIKEYNIIPRLVKIDVEGFEHPVLQGGENLFSNPSCNVIFIELNGSGKRYGFHDDEVHRYLMSKQFIPISYDPFLRSTEILSSYRKDKFNTIYIKKIDQVKEKLQKAPKIKVLNQFI